MTQSSMQTKHILLIDDDAELAELLTEYLESENFKVTSCLDGASGLAKAFDDNFDLILLDVMMPILNGFEVLKALGGNHKTPILMLTAKGDDNDRILGLELGADDYLAKPFKHRELLARINAILRRISIVESQNTAEVNITSKQLIINQVKVNQATREITCRGHLLELTGTEYLVLVYLIENHSKVISKAEISEQVLKRKLSPYDRTIDVHVGNVRRKLLVIDPIDKMKTVRGAGYVFLQGDE
ncbi:response regulator transcription factor [Colwellia psychrerythraea]|uniref:Two component transcriptional regulator, winged helix family n=1 Tax=Colwellia psychrerythraea TaxID=28229 RepID=A0A099KV62_COLPS|nr:response regulator transcription factor [Colwellia psychrerythraea]KGJ94095.1 two component transcriptional regulator, winged helix family [Colwellia psychrerythraea]